MKYSTLTSVTTKNLCEQVSFMIVSQENTHKLYMPYDMLVYRSFSLHAANKKGVYQISSFVVYYYVCVFDLI